MCTLFERLYFIEKRCFILAGKIKGMIDQLIQEKSKGNQVIANCIRTKLILKGIAVNKYTLSSPDEPEIIENISKIAKEFGITL